MFQGSKTIGQTASRKMDTMAKIKRGKANEKINCRLIVKVKNKINPQSLNKIKRDC